mmetsp:Transcript_40613/g.49420  ORF Transcript_40613/g.49420 Transcript_40613/m.49420 type:complete len:251 (-) Transcript_40613:520-1272(-)
MHEEIMIIFAPRIRIKNDTLFSHIIHKLHLRRRVVRRRRPRGHINQIQSHGLTSRVPNVYNPRSPPGTPFQRVLRPVPIRNLLQLNRLTVLQTAGITALEPHMARIAKSPLPQPRLRRHANPIHQFPHAKMHLPMPLHALVHVILREQIGVIDPARDILFLWTGHFENIPPHLLRGPDLQVDHRRLINQLPVPFLLRRQKRPVHLRIVHRKPPETFSIRPLPQPHPVTGRHQPRVPLPQYHNNRLRKPLP